MIAVIVGGLSYFVLAVFAFLATYGSPKRWSDAGMGWHIATFTVAVAALVGLLLAAMLGIHVPVWLGALVVVGLDAAMTWRLVLAIKARRRS